VNRPTEKQIKYCHDLAMNQGLSPEAYEHGQPLFEKSFAAADAFIKKHKGGKWTSGEMRDFENRNLPSDFGVPNS
jgi:hypothetical protein